MLSIPWEKAVAVPSYSDLLKIKGKSSTDFGCNFTYGCGSGDFKKVVFVCKMEKWCSVPQIVFIN